MFRLDKDERQATREGLQDGLQQALHRTLQTDYLKNTASVQGGTWRNRVASGNWCRVSDLVCGISVYFNDGYMGLRAVRVVVTTERCGLLLDGGTRSCAHSRRPAHRVSEGSGGMGVRNPHIYQLDYYYL